MNMKKRLAGLALIFVLAFAVGVLPYANKASAEISSISKDQESIEIDENASKVVANFDFSYSAPQDVTAAFVRIMPGTTTYTGNEASDVATTGEIATKTQAKYIQYQWTENGHGTYNASKGTFTPETNYSGGGGADSGTSENNIFSGSLVLTAGALAAGDYTVYVGYGSGVGDSKSSNVHTTLTLHVNPVGTKPEFASTSDINITAKAGDKSISNGEIALADDYVNSDFVEWSITDGEAGLTKLGLSFDPATHTISVADEDGLYYGSTTVTIMAKSTKPSYPDATKTVNVNVTGNTAKFDTAPGSKDIGKAYDYYTHGSANGLYTGEELTGEGTKAYEKALLFKASGTLPLEVSISGGLPAGLSFESSDEVDSSNAREGSVTLWITGTPTDKSTVTFSLKVKGAAGDDTTETYEVTVYDFPTFSMDNVDFTWDEENSKGPKSNNFEDTPKWSFTGDLNEDELVALGLSFDASSGTISGTWNTTGYDRNTSRILNFDNADVDADKKTATISKTLNIKAEVGGREVTEEVTLNFVLVPPEIEDYTFDFPYDKAAEGKVKAVGGGTVEWTVVTDLPDGLSDDNGEVSADNYSYLTISGTPKVVKASQEYEITATNQAGTTTKKINIAVSISSISLDIIDGEIVSGETAVGMAQEEVILRAYPGPISWDKSKLPDGVKWEVMDDYEDANAAVMTHPENAVYIQVSGTFSNATMVTEKKKEVPGVNEFSIVAYNSEYEAATENIPYELKIHGKPEITTDQKGKNWAITVGKVFKSAKLTFSTAAAVNSWDIRLSYTGATPAEYNEDIVGSWSSNDINERESYVFLENDYPFAFSGDKKYHDYLYVDTSGKDPIITGSIDRVPGDGQTGELTIIVYAIGPGGYTSKDFKATVTAVAPKIGKNTIAKDIAPETGDNYKTHTWAFTTTGSKPITMKATIAAKDAKKIFSSSIENDINITLKDDDGLWSNMTTPTTVYQTESSNPSRLVFWYDKFLGEGYLKYIRYISDDATPTDYSSQGYKGLPVTITLENAFSKAKGKPVTGSLKITANPVTEPSWYQYTASTGSWDQMTSPATTKPVFAATGVDGTSIDVIYSDDTQLHFIVKGDGPIIVTPSPKVDQENAKHGLVLKEKVNSEATDGKEYYIVGTPPAGAESKASFKLVAKNNSTGKASTLTINVTNKMRPLISGKATDDAGLVYAGSEVEIGKKVNIKGAAKGSKTIDWVVLGNYNGTGSLSPASLDSYGLSITKGALAGTPSAVTQTDGAYKSIDIYFAASNDVGITNGAADKYGVVANPPMHIKLGIKGASAKADIKQVTLQRGVEGFGLSTATNLLKTTAADATANVSYEMGTDAKTLAALEAIGLSSTITRVDSNGGESVAGNYGKLNAAGTDLVANKGASIAFVAKNYGTEIKGSTKVVVYDPTPVIEVNNPDATMTPGTNSVTVTMAQSDSDAVTKTFTLKPTAGTMATGDSKLAWKIGTKASKPLSVKLAADKNADARLNYATVTITLAKGTDFTSGNFTVTATNSLNKATSEAFTINVTSGAAAPETPSEETNALPEEAEAETEPEVETEPEAEAEEPETEEEPEGTITFGTARTLDSLTDAQKAFFEEGSYQIVAILPEVTVDVSGQYDIEVELAEDAPAGKELAYFAFPKDGITEEDDEIVDFANEAGELITTVPESLKVTVSPWFKAERTYAPVIAVKVEKTNGEKDDTEGLTEGDIVSEEAMKEAAEQAAEGEAEKTDPEAPSTETETGEAAE